MSHYSRVKTAIKNKASLVSALNDMGFTKEMLEVNDTPQKLHGYQGDQRAQTAEVIIPRQYVGGAANDIGFVKKEDGSYEAIISDFDKSNSLCRKNARSNKYSGYNKDWLGKLTQRYAYHELKEQLAEHSIFIESEMEENGEILLECSAGMFSGEK